MVPAMDAEPAAPPPMAIMLSTFRMFSAITRTFPAPACTFPPSRASAVPFKITRFKEMPPDALPPALAAPAVESSVVFSVAFTVTSPAVAVVLPLLPIPAKVLSSTDALFK